MDKNNVILLADIVILLCIGLLFWQLMPQAHEAPEVPPRRAAIGPCAQFCAAVAPAGSEPIASTPEGYIMCVCR